MKHVSSLCVLCNSSYSKWCYGQIMGIVTTVNVWERMGEYTLRTALHISWERWRVNPIFSTIIAKDVS